MSATIFFRRLCQQNIGMLFLFILFLCLSSIAFSQSERKMIKEGNRLFKENKFGDAEVQYKKSLKINKENPYATFNLGDTYYKEGKYEDAINQFNLLSSSKKISKTELAQGYHNIGNSYLQNKKYEESIQAFKNALKLNPADNDTRYNLAYAMSMLNKQQQQQNQKNDKNKDQNKKDQQKQQQQNKKDQQKKDEQKQAQQQKQKISKEDAEKILQALNNDEKNVQKKMQKKDGVKVAIEKNW